jgi:hypothetical protein
MIVEGAFVSRLRTSRPSQLTLDNFGGEPLAEFGLGDRQFVGRLQVEREPGAFAEIAGEAWRRAKEPLERAKVQLLEADELGQAGCGFTEIRRGPGTT